MRTAMKVAMTTLLGCGALLLALGLIIWTEAGPHEQLVAVHVVIGVVLVLTLWTITAFAARAGVPARTVAIAAAWGVLVVVLGLTQEELVPGSWHWTIQVLHLVISMGAIGWGRHLVRLIGRTRSAGEPRLTHPPIASSASH